MEAEKLEDEEEVYTALEEDMGWSGFFGEVRRLAALARIRRESQPHKHLDKTARTGI